MEAFLGSWEHFFELMGMKKWNFPAFSEGTLQKWLPDMIKGPFFEVFFAILARRVGCTTKPFWERKKHPNAVLFNPQCHMFQCTHRSEIAKMCPSETCWPPPQVLLNTVQVSLMPKISLPRGWEHPKIAHRPKNRFFQSPRYCHPNPTTEKGTSN